MSDLRFFACLLSAFAVTIVALLCVLDYMQAGPLNNELIKQIMFLVAPIIPAFLVLLHATANAQRNQAKIEDVKQAVEKAEQKADVAAKNAEHAAETASRLASKGN